ncbi:IclR family transcriptional regulator C-terminal domain-containing protein [Rhizobium sp. NPDC090275]|uniref:IclR family transcriptional regulator domain-containing protein n=1 Tax=Rhizobium sp. NPDC090275 TaxID=3364498 RepID=UPI00383B9551
MQGTEEIEDQGNDYSLTLARGIRILEIFTPEVQSVTTSEAADFVGISRAAARRFLLTLVTLGYLGQSKSSFVLTDKIATIGQGALARDNRWLGATARVIELSNRMNGLRIRFVARDQKRRIYSARLGVGDTLPAYCAAAGKVLLSTLEPHEIDDLIQKHGPLEKRTPGTIVDRDALLAELRDVRLRSCATADDEMDIGTLGIAVPIFDKNGKVIAALAVGSHKMRRSIEELERDFLPVLQDAADRISEDVN